MRSTMGTTGSCPLTACAFSSETAPAIRIR